MLLDRMLAIAEETAIVAGDHACRQADAAKEAFKPKNDEIVTQIDLQCQEIVIENIRRRFPEHGFIGEEGPDNKNTNIPPAGTDDIWWVIDPIDGTRNYAHGLPNYAVSIAAMQNGFPIVGVVYDPNTKKLFSARKGLPAKCNGRTIKCLDEQLNANSQLAVSGNLRKELPCCIAEIMDSFVYINLGSAALHYCYVALGAFSAAISWNVKLWDIAAGACIAQSAGAVIKNLYGKDFFPIDCTAYHGRFIHVIIAAESIQNQLKSYIEKDHTLSDL